MTNRNKLYLGLSVYILTFIAGSALFRLIRFVELIPWVNDIILFIGVIGIPVIQLFLIIKLIRSKVKKEVKIVFSTILIVLIVIWGGIGFVLSIFEMKPNYPFQYKGETYYYMNLGFPEPYYYIYKKDRIFTMTELSDQDVEKIFADSAQSLDMEVKSIIDGIIGEMVNLKEIEYEDKEEKEREIGDYTEKEETPEDKLDGVSMEDAVFIPDSPYAIVQADKAMARCQWFFVRMEGDKMNYISELPETSPAVEGRVDSKGVIYLKFEDIHRDVLRYRSEDNGLSWEQY